MPLPIDLVLIRHGESESNVANRADRAGNQTLISTPGHQERHSSEFRLTDTGIRQAVAAGAWLGRNFDGRFDYCLSSPFARAIETVSYLGLDDPGWDLDPYLVERDHGDLDGLSQAEKEARFGPDYTSRIIRHFYRRPPNGESRLDLGLRWDRIMLSLSQRHSEHRVAIVAHETIIEAGMIRRLHWTIEEFYEWKKANDPATKIHNCQIIQFSRRNPETKQVIDKVRWWRTVCPWDLSISDPSWRPIEARRFSSLELLDMANRYPRLINV